MGEKAVARLNEQYTRQLQDMLANVNASDRQALVASLREVRLILSGSQNLVVRIERLTVSNDDALAILQEH
jgi:hypothetical protein